MHGSFGLTSWVLLLTLCMLGSFSGFCCFQNKLLQKFLLGKLIYQTVSPDLDPNCLQRLSADNKGIMRNKSVNLFPIWASGS